MLAGFDIRGQERVSAARVLVVGAGGLGSPVCLYLAAAGVGTLRIADGDSVELTNLQRQILYATADVGASKVSAAAAYLSRLNPDVSVVPIPQRLSGESLIEQVSQVDVVVDATDNFATRFELNAACCAAHVPLVSAAAIRMEAQVAVYSYRGGTGPCYRCLYQDEQEIAESCSETGVLGPLVGIIGAIQALETLKVLTGMESSLDGKLLVLDARRLEWRTVKLRADPKCPICGPK